MIKKKIYFSLIISFIVIIIHILLFDFLINKAINLKNKTEDYSYIDSINNLQIYLFLYLKKEVFGLNFSKKNSLLFKIDNSFINEYITKNNYKSIIIADNFFSNLLDHIDLNKFNNKNTLIDYTVKNIIQQNSFYSPNNLIYLKNIKGNIDNLPEINHIEASKKLLNTNYKLSGFSNVDIFKKCNKVPLIINYSDKKIKNLTEIFEGDVYDRIYLKTYKISFNKKLNLYELQNFDFPLYILDNNQSYSLMSLTKNDIYLIKSKIDEYFKNFKLELNILKGRIKKSNKALIKEINLFLIKNNLPEDFIKEINIILSESDNIDYSLDKIINNLKSFENKDIKWRKTRIFFEKIKKKCIKIDTKVKTSDNLSLNDLIFNDRDIDSDILYTVKNYCIPSIIITAIANYFNTDDIVVQIGKSITIKNPILYKNNNKIILKNIVIPIDKNGFYDTLYQNTNSESNSLNKLSNYDFLILTEKSNNKKYILIMNIINQIVSNNSIYILNNIIYYLILSIFILVTSFLFLYNRPGFIIINALIFLFVIFLLSIFIFIFFNTIIILYSFIITLIMCCFGCIFINKIIIY